MEPFMEHFLLQKNNKIVPTLIQEYTGRKNEFPDCRGTTPFYIGGDYNQVLYTLFRKAIIRSRLSDDMATDMDDLIKTSRDHASNIVKRDMLQEIAMEIYEQLRNRKKFVPARDWAKNPYPYNILMNIPSTNINDNFWTESKDNNAEKLVFLMDETLLSWLMSILPYCFQLTEFRVVEYDEIVLKMPEKVRGKFFFRS